jgi:hypothetical protein
MTLLSVGRFSSMWITSELPVIQPESHIGLGLVGKHLATYEE